MRSVAYHHFPRIAFREGKKLLWNPIQKRSFKNRPEERVRLRLLDHLLLERNWSPHRISTEHAIQVNRQENRKRADILCFNQDFTPKLLIECKAENIKLGERTGQQIAVYNKKVNAPYLMLSNGLEDHLYHIDSERNISELEKWPDFLSSNDESLNHSFDYWADRGFIGNKTEPVLRPWLGKAQISFWMDHSKQNSSNITYLDLDHSPSMLHLEHYYKIFILKDHIKIDISFMATAFGGNRLVALINKNGRNEGIIEINLDLMVKDVKVNATIYSTEGEKGSDARSFLSFDFAEFDDHQLQHLPQNIINLFNHY